MNTNNTNHKDELDKMFPEAQALREREISNQARDILFDSLLGKTYIILTFTSVPASFFIFWLVFDSNFFLSVIYSFLYFYLFLYLFLYSLLMRPIEKKLPELNDGAIEKAGEKLKEMGF